MSIVKITRNKVTPLGLKSRVCNTQKTFFKLTSENIIIGSEIYCTSIKGDQKTYVLYANIKDV